MSDTDIQAETPASPAKSETRDFLAFLLKLGLFVFVLRSFIFAPFSIPSESMMPRLLVGDYLIVTKWNYGYSRHSFPFSLPLVQGRVFARTPARGDVVVFKEPPTNDIDVIKRVIGVPGDMVQLQGGRVVLNGTPVPKVRIADFAVPVSPNTHCLTGDAPFMMATGKPGCRYARFRETLPGGKSYEVLDFGARQADDTQVYAVPQGNVFLLGDDRDDSADSRREAGGFGFVPIENLVGRATVSVFSTDGSANLLLPWTWFTAARWSRIGEGF